ncbi:MAG: sugar phosphate isomerase/epimerase family protein [bacterium]
MKIAICNEIFKDWNWQKTCDFVSSIGYEGIEIAPFTFASDIRDLNDEHRREIREIAEKNGIQIIGLHWLLASPPGLHINHPDEAIRKETLQYMKELVRFCHSLAGEVMVFGSPKQRNILPGVRREQAWQWTRDFFLYTLEEAEKLGVFICLEPLSPRETNFINTAEEAIKLIEEISNPYFRLHLDVKAMSSEGKDIGEIIRKSAPYLKHFHANDESGKGPGFGATDFHPIIKALNEINYEGFLSVEIFDVSTPPEICAINSFKYLKEVMEDEDKG